MALQIAQLKACLFAAMFFSVLATQMTTAQEVKIPEKCNKVPEDIRPLAAALDVCDQLVAPKPNEEQPHNFAQAEIMKKNETAIKEQAQTAHDELEATRETMNLAYLTLAAQRHQYRDFLLKTSAYIIGGVGAGAGGALRLVNDKTVQHDGTVVTMVGGFVGASVNLFALACPEEPDLTNTKKQMQTLEPHSPLFKRYLGYSKKYKQICKDPTLIPKSYDKMLALTSKWAKESPTIR